MGTASYKNRLFDVRKDRLDLRDRVYQPRLRSLPNIYPNFENIDMIIKSYQASGMILNQGPDGACTGYALASTINYLLWRKAIESSSSTNFLESPLAFDIKRVSTKMLYNLARIYDEWEGEDYEGSSCRGAMKGWHKHGVCEEQSWEFFEDEPMPEWQKEAVERPLGAYYRVDKESIVDMQSALCEVGALYVSAAIHDGWWQLKDLTQKEIEDIAVDIPYIPYYDFPVGNHAFVIVGYTRYGFIIQNSWGSAWGNSGFAILSYKDWLEHGMDVWVAVMGVPVDVQTTPNTVSALGLNRQSSEAVEGTKIMQKALSYAYKNDKLAPISEQQAYNHTLVLNSYGRAKHTIIYTSTLEKSIDIICYKNVKKWLDANPENHKIALYALGGFYEEKESLSKIRVLAPYLLQNGIYPIFLSWQDSYYQAIHQSIETFFNDLLTSGGQILKAEDILKDKVALSRAIENHCRKISTRSIWSEVKEKASKANAEEIEPFNTQKRGVLHILTDAFQKLQQEYGYRFEIHAIAHSAGSQLIATDWLVQLADRGMQLKSLHLIAPTLTIREANESIIYAQEQALFDQNQIHLYMLSQGVEEEDSVSRYDKSLLILISRALEKIHKTPLLGLEEAWYLKNAKPDDGVFNRQQSEDISVWHQFAVSGEQKCVKHIIKKGNLLKSSIQGDSVKLSHKNLDRSIEILDQILKIIATGEISGKLDCSVENLS